jgi:hypothetical protein
MEVGKPTAEVMDEFKSEKNVRPLDETHQNNAVGYKEYVEGLELDITEKEVSDSIPHQPVVLR